MVAVSRRKGCRSPNLVLASVRGAPSAGPQSTMWRGWRGCPGRPCPMLSAGGDGSGGPPRDRGWPAIKELDYKPHAGAASLRSGRTYRIAYPIPANEFLPDNVIMLEFLQFLVAAARARCHQVLVG